MKHGRSAKKLNKTADIKQYKRDRYRDQHEEVYYTVNNIPMNKDLWDFVNKWLDETRVYKDKLVYNDDVMNCLKKNKQIERRELTDAEKNGLRAAIVYIYNEMKTRGKFDRTNIYNNNIRSCSNNLKINMINQFLNALTDQKMSANKQLNGKVLIDVDRKTYYSKRLECLIKAGKCNSKTALVNVRSFKLTKAINDKEINVSLKLTPNALLNWDLFTPEQMEEVCNHLDDDLITCYLNCYSNKDNAYVDYENKYRGFHLNLTANEQTVINRYKDISIDYKTVDEIIKNTPFAKTNVEYETIKDVSYMLSTLKQRKITFKHGRLYYPRFTTLSSKYVERVLFLNGKHLLQIFDVKSCFVVMSMLLYCSSSFRTESELKKLYNKIINEDFYVWVGTALNIKQEDDETFTEWRDRCKEMVISWLFKTSSAKIKCNIDKLIQCEFPTYYSWLHSLDDIWDNKDNKRKCVLSVQCSWLENKLILNGLFNLVSHLDAVTKHDAIYIAEDQYSEQLKEVLESNFNKIINKIMKGFKNEKENKKANWN